MRLKKKMGTSDCLGLHPRPLDLADILPGLLGVGGDQQRWGQLHISCPQVSAGGDGNLSCTSCAIMVISSNVKQKIKVSKVNQHLTKLLHPGGAL